MSTDLDSLLDQLFDVTAALADTTGSLEEIGRLLAFCNPSLLLLADHQGKPIAAFSPAGAGLEGATLLAAELSRNLRVGQAVCLVEACAPASRPSAFAIPLECDLPADFLGVVAEPAPELPAWLDTMAPALRASARIARTALAIDREAISQRTRLRHLLVEQETLKAAHTEATTKAIEEHSRRLREQNQREAMERTCLATEAANRAKSQFLANMSHEIRTPLNAILGFAELLVQAGETFSPEERHEYLETIHSSGRHLLELINDILDLSKIEAGRMKVEKVRCSPRAIVSGVLGALRGRAEEKGLVLADGWPNGAPASILSDPTRLHQLLFNLIGNAIKFTERGSVRVVVRLVGEGPKRLAFEINDTGIGIEADKLGSIFDAFVQADNSVTRRFGGTGLGLSICRWIVQELGGEITVRSQLGEGSTFTASIDPGPLEGVAMLSADDRPAETAEPIAAAVALPPCRVLVVDDGATNRKFLSLVLRRAGAEVVTAENGQEGVERALEQSFDVILMDMQMPVLDGYSAARALRERGLQTPILALTAHAMAGDDRKCLDAGCSGYLSKPVGTEKLLRAVAAALAPEHRPLPPAGAPVPDRASAQADASAPGSPVALEDQTPLVSSLPMDDADFREIVADFSQALAADLARMRSVAAEGDWAVLARQAHALKGTGGTAGFPAIAAAARELELRAKEGNGEAAEAAVDALQRLASRIVIPDPGKGTSSTEETPEHDTT